MSYEQWFQDFLASQKYRWFRRMSALVGLFIGLMLASYPENHPEWAPWSDYLFQKAQYLFPPDSDLPKKFTAVGFDFIVVAIVISPTTKDFLSNRLLLWFGKQSFAVYLIHGTLLRVPLIWALYGISGEPWIGTVDDAGNVTPPDWLPVRGLPWSFMISIPCWIVLVYGCATLWTTYVDPFCARMTQKLEDRFFEEDEKSSPAIPMTTRPMPMT
jgi:transcription initiation factor TFIID subunit 11